MNADGSIEVVQGGSECSSQGPAGGWTHCEPVDEGGSSSGGDATTGDGTLDVCECGCTAFPG